MSSLYIDTPSTIQVIGGVYLTPALLDQEKYNFSEEDFPNQFHKIVFGAIYNLYKLGAKTINAASIEEYLQEKPKSYAVFKNNKGLEYLDKLAESTRTADFDYHYNRLKKMTLLRMYDSIGVDVSFLYDPSNILDIKKKQEQEVWLDNVDLTTIADTIDKKIDDIKLRYADKASFEFQNAGSGIYDLIEKLKEEPEFGYPLYGPLINTVTRGARLKKFYLRSAPTGVAKTRMMIADACSTACDEIWDEQKQGWVRNGTREPTLYITTEQQLSEIQTMMLAFVSAVQEQHILTGKYLNKAEEDRVLHAATILSLAPIYIKEMPDFTMNDIENNIKYAVRQFGVKYIFEDYIHSSMSILSQVSSKAGVSSLRQDNVLFMIGVKLKDICNKYGVFIMSSTQLNGQWQSAEVYDQNLLRGAKSLGDKIDLGMIVLPISKADRDALKSIVGQGEMPELKIAIYKNRRGRWKDILLWCRAKRGICRIEPLFCTGYDYSLIDMKDTKIEVG